MGNAQIQTTLVSLGAGSGFNDEQDDYVECFRALVNYYVPGLPNFYKGLRPLSSEDLNIPCAMVQAVSDVSEYTTNAKIHTFWPFDFYYVVADDTVDACSVKVTNCAMIFRKLFSNDALNDFSTSGKTLQYKTYQATPFGSYTPRSNVTWTNSEMKGGIVGVPFILGRPSGPKYAAAGYFRLTLETQKLI